MNGLSNSYGRVAGICNFALERNALRGSCVTGYSRHFFQGVNCHIRPLLRFAFLYVRRGRLSKPLRCAWVQIPACYKFSQNKIPKGGND